MGKAKAAAIKLPRIVGGGNKRRKLVALLVVVAVITLIVKYPVATADVVATVVGGVDQFIQALRTA
nr:hypothetical protein [Kibdelosporangium sp. MJ126-NF4]CEL15080.1 hypothetical protein [Kibdelosporangium sp. MJ126-NF4]CTQ93326.1 hypothetical protein [Kibdelosporangium sp. MJ126-NF4]